MWRSFDEKGRRFATIADDLMFKGVFFAGGAMSLFPFCHIEISN